ncbi:MAG: exodeoxyribonuclease V subunit alpha [Microthrixaceae bacterium]
MSTTSLSATNRAVPEVVGFLSEFVEAGVFNQAEVHLAATIARLAPQTSREVLLAVAVAARGPRMGHICVVLEEVAGTALAEGSPRTVEDRDPAELPWPAPADWSVALEACPDVVSDPASAGQLPLRPLIWDGTRLYLQRYWSHEEAVAASLLRRAALRGSAFFTSATNAQVDVALDTHFGPPEGEPDSPGGPLRGQVPDLQRQAAALAMRSTLSVIAGGPGTGKTTTVAKLLLVAADLAQACGQDAPRIALAAPTGKAAARLTEAVSSSLGERESPCAPATTIHRLLGAIPGVGFRANAAEPLEVDMVVLDETSMVDVSLMAHLLDALRPETTLVLVGDPNQLASVEAGTVLGDIVAAASMPGSPLEEHLTVLTRVHRFGSASPIASLAEAVRVGDADRALGILRSHGPSDDAGAQRLPLDTESVERIDPSDSGALEAVTTRLAIDGTEVVRAARGGDSAAATRFASEAKLLAATRRGDFGLYDWTDRIESAVADAVEGDGSSLRRGERWYVGKPVLITANDPIVGVANGDVGVVVDDDGERMVAVGSGDNARHVLPARLGSTEPWWAMTIHKSQGSEFPEVIVSLPDRGSPILTRELLYTAVTRARRSVSIIASEERLREAVEHPVARASGLVGRLGSP